MRDWVGVISWRGCSVTTWRPAVQEVLLSVHCDPLRNSRVTALLCGLCVPLLLLLPDPGGAGMPLAALRTRRRSSREAGIRPRSRSLHHLPAPAHSLTGSETAPVEPAPSPHQPSGLWPRTMPSPSPGLTASPPAGGQRALAGGTALGASGGEQPLVPCFIFCFVSAHGLYLLFLVIKVRETLWDMQKG